MVMLIVIVIVFPVTTFSTYEALYYELIHIS